MKEYARVEVGYINTPLEKLENISKHFQTNIYVKRDDMTGLALGGNKTRKLDYIVKYALDNGYTTLLTYGAPQTNHGRLTIAAAVKFGLKSILVCEAKAVDKAQGNLILDKMMGGELIFIEPGQDKESIVRELIATKEANGEKVLEVPMGGSSALGAYGYFKCMEEIINQLKEKDIKIDYVFSAYGSTGTFAGLYLGAKYYQADFEVLGIPVFPTPFSKESCVEIINELAHNIEIDITTSVDDIQILGGMENNLYAGPAYGKSDEKIRQAMYLLAAKEALISDPCYTGKVVYGMFECLKQPQYQGKNILFIHTGGYPALFASPFQEDVQEIYEYIQL